MKLTTSRWQWTASLSTPCERRNGRCRVPSCCKPLEAARQVKVERIAARPRKEFAGKYRVIYADPPWSYGASCWPDGVTIARDHYPTMSLDEICKLPVRDLVEDNAVLFVWVPAPILFEAARVIEAWGFDYKTHFVWDKVKHNVGHYNSVRHELLLICTRGSCTPDAKKLFDSVQSIERTKHSEKPEEFRKIIETLYTAGGKIELFARGPARPGWVFWGHEAQNGMDPLGLANLPVLPPPPGAVLPLPPPPISQPAVAQTFLGEQ
jgi:N6-adenosine-specific RNA methylase IME4